MLSQVKDKFGRPVRDLRISVTDRCNFRCTYCMPLEVYGERYKFLNKTEILTFDEITRLVKVFVSLGVNKVRLTGGEPLLRHGLESLISDIAGIQGVDDLTVTTNGYLLASKALDFKNAGLNRISVSLDTLDDEIFKQMNGKGYSTARVLQGIKTADEIGLRPIKINVVVKKHLNEASIIDIARYFKGSGHIVRFIEYMDVGTINKWDLQQVVSADRIFEIINKDMPIEPISSNYMGEVALRYKYVDGSGEIGIIASVTKPFCGDCTRARLSTDGKLYTCLFASTGGDLKGPLRSGATQSELRDLISGMWSNRTDRYSEERESKPKMPEKKIEMYQIGG